MKERSDDSWHGGHHGGHLHHAGRIGRGDVRDLLLAALLDGPAHGYELMSRLEERTGGRWRPSPGSVYPSLQALEDQGLAASTDANGRKVYELTEAGRAKADRGRLEELSAARPSGAAHHELRAELQSLHSAARQVGAVGSALQVEQAADIVGRARKALYRLLSD
jgi:DNA-binding PadR family transcriptional regulator